MRGRTELPLRVLGAAMLFASSSVAAAHAEPATASLVATRDDGARGCPDAAALAAQVQAIVGRDLVRVGSDADTRTWIRIELTGSFDGYRAMIQMHGERSGSRQISDVGPGCANLAGAVAVALAVLLDPDPGPSGPVVAAPPLPYALPPPSAPAPSVPAVHERTAARPREPAVPDVSGFGAELSVGIGVAVLEHAVPMLEAAARWQFHPRVELALGAGSSFDDHVQTGDAEVELGLSYGFVRACTPMSPRAERALLELCIRPMLGRLTGSGHDFDVNRDEHVLWAAIGVGVEANVGLFGGLSGSIRALGLAPLVRQGFSTRVNERQTETFVTPRLGALLALAVFYES